MVQAVGRTAAQVVDRAESPMVPAVDQAAEAQVGTATVEAGDITTTT